MTFEFDLSVLLKPVDFLPFMAREVLQVGSVPAMLAVKYYPNAVKLSSTAGDTPESGGPVRASHIDCIVIGQTMGSPGSLAGALARHMDCLNEYGRVVLLFNIQDDLPFSIDDIDRILGDNDLIRYRVGRLGNVAGASSRMGVVAVKSTYNPVAHARRADAQGRPDSAIAILDAIPGELIQSNDLIARLALEKQRYFLNWQKNESSNCAPHTFFSKERREFAQVTAIAPDMTDAYHIHAQYWSYLGRFDMARRVLRSIGHCVSDMPACKVADKTPEDRPDGYDAGTLPPWNPRVPLPRILVITHDYSDYGMDTLYHGLCTLLGKENVVEYPWKPTLHGRDIEKAQQYPCVFNFSGKPLTVDHLEDEIRRGKFDLILYADVVQMAHGCEVRRLINADTNIPVVLYDTWDDCHTPLHRILRYIGRKRFDVLFKREMLTGVQYDPRTYPLPFGYAESFIHAPHDSGKTDTVFWAGKNEYGLRPLYIRSLEKILGRQLNQRYDQAAYQTKVAAAKIGLSFFGCGFDSVRYWELPANGAMLMAERPPIRIPHNFEDGHTAVFFDDLPEMEAKLEYYMHRPEEISRIAAAGHAHYRTHHTTVGRARQFLAAVDLELNGRLSGSTRFRLRPAAGDTAGGIRHRINMGLVKGENYGWGVCSKYLIEEMSKLQRVHVLNDQDGSAFDAHLEGKLLQALTTVELSPLFKNARGRQNFGYTFFENELTRKSIQNARQFDLVLAGSSWCRDRMLEKGISNCDVLIQGIDPDLFYPIESKPPQDRFVIFSGGKFELRKGQDLVLRAVQILQNKYPDVYLVNCWYNLWPQSVQQMTFSPYISFSYRGNDPWINTMERTYRENGLDADRIFTLDLLPQHAQREMFSQTHVGVFPNRCEGGTNLVLMEYMACAKPVIAAFATGQKDILSEDNALLLRQLKDMEILDGRGARIGRWQDPSLDELVAQLEYAYHHRESIDGIGRRAGGDLQHFTWKHCAERLSMLIGR